MRKTDPTPSLATIGYVRVSTEDQAREGVSLEAQRATIHAWCDANGYTLVAIHKDAGLSGKRTDNRPGLLQAIEQACLDRAALVAYSISRLPLSTRGRTSYRCDNLPEVPAGDQSIRFSQE